MTTSNASGISTAPATPMASTPSANSDPAPTAPTTAPRNPPFSSSHTCKINNLNKKWVINLSKNPPHSRSATSFTKRSQLCHNTQLPPHGSLHNIGGRGFLQTSIHVSRWTKIRHQSLTQISQHAAQQPQQPQPIIMQSTHTAQTGHIQGATHNLQGGGHGHHGSTGLHQQGQCFTSRHQHI